MASDGAMRVSAAAGVGKDLPRLTSLRAFAAFAVFLFHVRKNTEWSVGDSFVAHGYTGVGFFFILSGFVLTWSTKPSVTTTDFYVRRIARVYPSHFVMLLIALMLPRLAHPVTPTGIVANVTLTQAWFPDWDVAFGLNAVSWSLSNEFFFYAFTPFLLRATHRWSTRRVIAVLGTWFLCSAIAAAAMGLAGNATDVYAYANPAIRSGEFVLGILLAMLAIRGKLPAIPMWTGVGTVAAAWALTYNRWLPQSIGDLIFDIPFVILIAAAASADIHDKQGILRHRWLVYAGQVSFAYYLVHELVLFNGAPLWGAGPSHMLARLALTAAVAIACFLLAMALHEWVERPLQRRIRHAYSLRQSRKQGG